MYRSGQCNGSYSTALMVGFGSVSKLRPEFRKQDCKDNSCLLHFGAHVTSTFVGEDADMTVYNIQNQWGGSSAPWHDGGVFNIGNRADQLPIALKIQPGEGGLSCAGTMTYHGEGPIGLRATRVTENCYHAENQWGGASAPWHDAGLFLLGARDGQNAV
eukprot:gene30548-34675_t